MPIKKPGPFLTISPNEPPIVNSPSTCSVGDNISAAESSWTFGGDVAVHFDSHINRSIPHYSDGHKLVCSLSSFFVRDHSRCYDLGCSTGTLTEALALQHTHRSQATFIGLDSEQEMHLQASRRCQASPSLSFVQANITEFDYEESDFIVAYYVMQFVAPKRREALMRRLYHSLQKGGAFILFEKVRAPNARLQDICSMLYHDYKENNGYTPENIVAKAKSLRGILEPYTREENIELLKKSGFQDIMTVWKHLCFEGFLAIKT